MADRPLPRGRARGRARPDPGVSSQSVGLSSEPPSRLDRGGGQVSRGTHPTWGSESQQHQAYQHRMPAPAHKPDQTYVGGRVKHKIVGDVSQSEEAAAAVAGSLGRGGVRNFRILEQNTLITKPKDLVSKQGT